MNVQVHMLPDQHELVDSIKELGVHALYDARAAFKKVQIFMTCI